MLTEKQKNAIAVDLRTKKKKLERFEERMETLWEEFAKPDYDPDERANVDRKLRMFETKADMLRGYLWGVERMLDILDCFYEEERDENGKLSQVVIVDEITYY